MSDDLVLRGGGAVTVATDGHLHLARVLVSLGSSCAEWADRVETVAQYDTTYASQGPVAVPGLDHEAGRASAARAVVRLRRASDDAAGLAGKLVTSAEAYGDVERVVASLFETSSAASAWLIGSSPGLLIVGALGLSGVALTGVLLRTVIGALSGEAGEQLDADAARTLRDVMATPAFADAVRSIVSSTDDLLVGFGGLPALLSALNRAGQGASGVAFAALVVARGAELAGIFPGSVPVTASTVSHRKAEDDEAVGPPQTHEDLVDRMPKGGEGSPQIRIERHLAADGTDQWIVWTGGTIETGLPTSSTEPWDNQSNLRAVAGAAAESTAATREAMRLAGIPDGASVMHVGYSQGGIVAAAIAASGDFDSSVVTFGAPVETVPFPDDLPRTHVEHEEDVIPALSGTRRDPVDGGTVVRRSLYDGGPPPPGDDPLPAHSRDRYRETARLIDGSEDPRLHAVLGPLTGLSGPGESWEYRADRVR